MPSTCRYIPIPYYNTYLEIYPYSLLYHLPEDISLFPTIPDIPYYYTTYLENIPIPYYTTYLEIYIPISYYTTYLDIYPYSVLYHLPRKN